MRTTTSFLLAALATAAIAHSVNPNYHKQGHDNDDPQDRAGTGWGDMADHDGSHPSGDDSGKGFLSSIKHYGHKAKGAVWDSTDDDETTYKDSHARPGAGHYGHGSNVEDDDEDDNPELEKRGWFSKKKGSDHKKPTSAGHPDWDSPNMPPPANDPSDRLPNNLGDIPHFENEEWYDDEGNVLPNTPGTAGHRVTRDAGHGKHVNWNHDQHFENTEHYDDDGNVKSHGLHFPNEEYYDDESRRIPHGHQNMARDADDDWEDETHLKNLPDDAESRRHRQAWYDEERRSGHRGKTPATGYQKSDFAPYHHLGHAPVLPRDMQYEADDDDDETHLKNLPQDDDSRRHRQSWYENENRNGVEGQAPQGSSHSFRPSHHRFYSKHQMRGVDVDRDAATNSDQYYYDVGDEGDEGEYDPSYGSEDYDGFEKRAAKKAPKPPPAPKPKKGKGWSLFPW